MESPWRPPWQALSEPAALETLSACNSTDGRPHPLLNVASICTLVVGLASFVLGLYLRYGTEQPHPIAITAAATGLASLLVGLFTQMMSATREERILIVTGIIARLRRPGPRPCPRRILANADRGCALPSNA